MTKKVKGKNKTKQSVSSSQALEKLHIRLMDERQYVVSNIYFF